MEILYVSKDGNGRWSGTLPEAAEDRKDGPFPSLDAARLKIREHIRNGRFDGPVTVRIRGGVYPLTEPIVFTPEDSYPITYEPYPGEEVIFDGGQEIAGWREETVNGIPMWTTVVPETASGAWYFRQLFANGERRELSRYPREGYSVIRELPGLDIAKAPYNAGSDRFIANAGDIGANWRNLTDACVVAFHYWAEEHLPIKSFDAATGLCISTNKSSYTLRDDKEQRGADYYVENVFEALDVPGRWYLDRADGKLYYVPMAGEILGDVVFRAPVAKQLIRLEGKPEEGRFVEYLKFKGFTFRNAERSEYIPSGQSAPNAPGAILLRGARRCSVEDCAIRNIGAAAVELESGCIGNHILRNVIYDIGGCGIKLMGPNVCADSPLRNGNNTISDNRLHKLGRIFTSAAGILATHSAGNTVSHNEIHDLYYTGISCGWVWGYDSSASTDNLIEKNHIYDIGHGVLSDMGGIYTLGVQPGTVIRGNLIHDVEMRNYGGWGIYPDEGSSHLIIEDNIVYDVSGQAFHQHYGRENIIRNNIFSFGRLGQAIVSLVENHNSATFDRNLFISKGTPMYFGNGRSSFANMRFLDNCNLYWDYDGEPFSEDIKTGLKYSIAEMQAAGKYNAGVFADPLFRDPDKRDFTLADGSPALKMGFKPIDMSGVGPRKDGTQQ